MVQKKHCINSKISRSDLHKMQYHWNYHIKLNQKTRMIVLRSELRPSFPEGKHQLKNRPVNEPI